MAYLSRLDILTPSFKTIYAGYELSALVAALIVGFLAATEKGRINDYQIISFYHGSGSGRL